MKASALVEELQKRMEVEGDLDLKINLEDDIHGVFTQYNDDGEPSGFLICDEDTLDELLENS